MICNGGCGISKMKYEESNGEIVSEAVMKLRRNMDFVSLFGANPKQKGKYTYDAGYLLSKGEIENILRENGFVNNTLFGGLKLLWVLNSRFWVSYYSWYKFHKVITEKGDVKYQLAWECDEL